MDPFTTAALIKGGAAVGKWAWNRFNKPKSFEDTEYGKRLKMISQQGVYSSQMRGEIIGGVSRSAGNLASQARTNYRGRMIASGMENSIAGARGEADIGTSYMDTVADTTRRIEFENAQSKIQAGNQLAEQSTMYKDRIDQFNQQNNMQLGAGLIDAAATGVGAWNQSRMELKDLPLDKRLEIENRQYTAETGRINANANMLQSKNYGEKIAAMGKETTIPNIGELGEQGAIEWAQAHSKDENEYYQLLYQIREYFGNNNEDVTWTRKKVIH